jgi:hypothetical protein
VILRSVAGYVVAPRPTVITNASRYDRILVMPTTSPTRPAPPQPAFAQPQFQQPPQFQPPFPMARPPVPQQQPPIDDADADADDIADEPSPNVVMPNLGLPLFNGARPLPQQMPTGSGVRPAPGQVPAGVAVPGMVVPAPATQPGVPPQPPDFEP